MLDKNQIQELFKIVPPQFQYIASVHIDFFIDLKHKEIDALVNKLAKDITSKQSKRKKNHDAYLVFINSIRVILLNLLKSSKHIETTALAIPLDANVFSKKDRYTNNISYRQFKDAFDGLKDIGYIEIVNVGYWDKAEQDGRLTRIKPSKILLDIFNNMFVLAQILFSSNKTKEIILLRGEDGKPLEYKDDKYTIKSRNNLRKINNLLKHHWYDIAISDKELINLCQNIALDSSNYNNSVYFDERTLYRIFNNGSFTCGGRFYGGWWQNIPSEFRQKITIDCKPTVEIDYACYHASILYALEDIEYMEDAYLIDNINKYKNKKYLREMGKIAFNKLINGKRKPFKPKQFNSNKAGIDWDDLVKAIKKKHVRINKYFSTGYGIELQRKDSDLAERIMLHFVKKNVVCLPIHDSFIVSTEYKDELKETMLSEYKKIFNKNIKLKTEETNLINITDNINTLLATNSGYKDRYNIWYESTNK